MNNQDNQNFNGFEDEASPPGSQSYERERLEDQRMAEESSFSDLNADLPKLGGSASLGVNKKGLFFLAIVGVVGFSLATVAYQKVFSSSDDEVKPVRDEAIIIPDRDFTAMQQPVQPVVEAPPQADPLLDIPSLQLDNVQDQQQAMAIPVNSTEEKPLTLADRRVVSGAVINTGEGGGMLATAGVTDPEALAAAAAAGMDTSTVAVTKDVRRLNNKDTLLLRGTYIRCVLETKLNSQLSGPTSCVVTDPIYSASGKRLLIERGSRVFGDYRQDDAGVYDRVAILWARVITPSGRDIQLNSPGTDSLGGSGHPGKYSAHWGSRLAAAILVSMTADVFNYAGVKYGPKVTTTTRNSDGTVTVSEDSFDSKTADSISKMPEQILSKTLNRPATVTINQGTLINIYTIKDIDFAPVLD